MKIMLVEDDRTIHYGLKQHLLKTHSEVISAYTFSEGERLIDPSVELYILDVTLPDGTGLELVQLIRETQDTPVIFLSAHDDDITIDKGFMLGGDDYITKPFRLVDLDNRICSIQRRSNVLKVNHLSIDLKTARVFIKGEQVVLSVTEYQLLLELVNHSPNVISKQDLIRKIWDEASDNTLSVNIRRLRSKLGNDVCITSVANEGYSIS